MRQTTIPDNQAELTTLRTITGGELLHMSLCMLELPYQLDEALDTLRGLRIYGEDNVAFVSAIERQLIARRTLAGFFYLNL